MKQMKFTVLALTLFISTSSHATWGIWQDYIIIDSGSGNQYHAGGQNADAAPTFNNRYYGNFSSSSTFVLNGGENKTFKNGSSNVCGGTLYYRVYRINAAPGGFNSVNLPYCCDLGGGDQKWTQTAANINLLAGLTSSGAYFLEAYWQAEGNNACSFCCGEYILDDNTGSYYKAYFDYTVFDTFSDNDFTASPAWSGDTGSWIIVSNSDAAAGATNSRTLRLNAATGPNTQHLSSPISSWDAQQEWAFWFGRRAQAATLSNQSMFWLYANEANLESATVDGYRIVYGDDTGGD